MAEPTPFERLQPCLLDRLTDDEPGSREESRSQRVVSHQKYRRGVLRDLDWLFNCSAFLPLKVADGIDLRKYPEAYRSVINYGTRQITGQMSPDLVQLRDDLAEAIAIFEPRMAARTLTIQANVDRNFLVFDIAGDLWANPIPEHLHLKTTIDFETGQCVLGDAPNG
jgi:type VI secretion system protein ImpF